MAGQHTVLCLVGLLKSYLARTQLSLTYLCNYQHFLFSSRIFFSIICNIADVWFTSYYVALSNRYRFVVCFPGPKNNKMCLWNMDAPSSDKVQIYVWQKSQGPMFWPHPQGHEVSEATSEMLKSFWTSRSKSRIWKIMPVQIIKYAVIFYILCQSE